MARWLSLATWAQRARLAQEIHGQHVHYVWLGTALCGRAKTGAALTELPSLTTCPGCRAMSVWAIAHLAEISKEISIVLTERFAVYVEKLGEAFGTRKPPPRK